jgi:hypothetical protein
MAARKGVRQDERLHFAPERLSSFDCTLSSAITGLPSQLTAILSLARFRMETKDAVAPTDNDIGQKWGG